MKKQIVLFISTLVLGLGFSSCSDDDSQPSLLGKWNLEKQEERDENNNVTGTWEVEYECETNKTHYFDIKENGEVEIISYRSNCTQRLETIQWEQVNNKTIFFLDVTFEVAELTNSKLVLKYTDPDKSSFLIHLKR